MKRIVIYLLIITTSQSINAQQSVGIGTTTPNPKAILDISSINKGLLIPSMATSQRLAITSPPNGLMVYDTDKGEFYHYNNIGWTPILNGNYWTRPNSNRKRIANFTDSVGIGLTSATEWLDVDGNIRSRNNLLADNNVTATGTVQGGALFTGGNLTAGGTGIINGDLTTNSDLIINNTAAILQLKNNSVNKGFFQLSGDNVRLGTNSGNSTGNLVIRMNANDRITVNPQGDIDLEGKITRNAATGTASLIPFCYGRIGYNGSGVLTILSGTGNFTFVRGATGGYIINCTGITANSIVTVSGTDRHIILSAFAGDDRIDVQAYKPETSAGADCPFSFIVYNP